MWGKGGQRSLGAQLSTWVRTGKGVVQDRDSKKAFDERRRVFLSMADDQPNKYGSRNHTKSKSSRALRRDDSMGCLQNGSCSERLDNMEFGHLERCEHPTYALPHVRGGAGSPELADGRNKHSSALTEENRLHLSEKLRAHGDQHAVILHDNQDVPDLDWIPKPVFGLAYSNPFVFFIDGTARLYAYDLMGRDMFLLGETPEIGLQRWMDPYADDWPALDPQNGKWMG
ncbi:uncharacterized protein EV422DRAFT_544160 [Fimicolochytrium jonesii]|uniref:uncharacterized protein n=1 Tax=Fimicolochytrium jonesii TaxID=1396493 RepID=UPI0022FF2BC3|nr:uncharacterized protein EV422DRAFT_544160 [Fimicolochytrium jonesii]KAI8816834.1 hypothetical protein EV422DRAFT_544160 [Fimicolochytrium jonesii]